MKTYYSYLLIHLRLSVVLCILSTCFIVGCGDKLILGEFDKSTAKPKVTATDFANRVLDNELPTSAENVRCIQYYSNNRTVQKFFLHFQCNREELTSWVYDYVALYKTKYKPPLNYLTFNSANVPMITPYEEIPADLGWDIHLIRSGSYYGGDYPDSIHIWVDDDKQKVYFFKQEKSNH